MQISNHSATAPSMDEIPLPDFFSATALYFSGDSTAYVRRLVEVAWLLMAEGHPILEDMDGAMNARELVQSIKLVFAEFLADLDLRVAGVDGVRGPHVLALALENGTGSLVTLSGTDFARLLNLANVDSFEFEKASMERVWQALLSDFPIALVDPLQADNQGAVLTMLRQWTRMCKAFDVPSDFLVILMKSV